MFAGVNSYLPFPSLVPFSNNDAAGTGAAGSTARARWRRMEDLRRHRDQALSLEPRPRWVDVSRTAGGAYNVPIGDMWVFEQCGTKLVAVNINDDPQVIDIDSGTHFADLAGSPPQRRPRQADRRFSVPVAARHQSAHHPVVGHQRHHRLDRRHQFVRHAGIPRRRPGAGHRRRRDRLCGAGSHHPHDAIPARRHDVYFQFLARAE